VPGLRLRHPLAWTQLNLATRCALGELRSGRRGPTTPDSRHPHPAPPVRARARRSRI